MTIPAERSRAIRNTRNFLRRLIRREETPRVSPQLRNDASWLLKHFPSDLDIEQSAKKAPDIWGKIETEIDSFFDE